MSATARPEPCRPELRSLGPAIPLPLEAPQDIAVDPATGTLWITSGLSNEILVLDADLDVVGSIDAPFLGSPAGATGIAYDELDDALWVIRPTTQEAWQLARDGEPTGRVVFLDLPPPVNIIPRPFPRGIAFDRDGDGGRGSLWVVESVMTAVYEVALDGAILRSFCHPDDPDGCPGTGRAAFARDVGLIRDGEEVVELELVGGLTGDEQVRRLSVDGELEPFSIPLREIGGSPGAFARGTVVDPESGESVDAFYVTVESSAELQVLAVIPALAPAITELTCTASASAVELTWNDHSAPYVRTEILRDGKRIALLDAGARSFTDPAPSEGVSEYVVRAHAESCVSELSCLAVVGAGRVLASATFEHGNAQDLAEDNHGTFWVTTRDNLVVAVDGDFEIVETFSSPFADEDSLTTGIAYDSANDLLFVYDTATHRIAPMHRNGFVLASAPTPSGYTVNEDEPRYIAALLFDPAGDAGAGSFWYYDASNALYEERTRRGALLRSCPHPDDEGAIAPDGSPFLPLAWGLSAVPGKGFELLEASMGAVRDSRVNRIAQIRTADCAPTGFEIPLAGLASISRPPALVYHRTRGPEGEDVAIAINTFTARPYIARIDASGPEVPPPTQFECSQPTGELAVYLSFAAPEGVDRIEIRRDGELIARLSESDTSYTDRVDSTGLFEYAITAQRGRATSDERRCTVRVGPGSIASREFVFPAPMVVHQVAFDPQAREYVAASTTRKWAGQLYFYDENLVYRRSAPSPFQDPVQIAAMAVRPRVGASWIYALGWTPGLPPTSKQKYRMRVVTPSGEVVDEFDVEPPRPRETFLVFPSGLAWDEHTESLWLLERNAAVILQLSPDGDPISSFPHPAPFHQDRVHNYGVAIDAARGALYLTSGDRLDQSVTSIVELTRSGRLSGWSVPVGDEGFYRRLLGFTLDATGTGFVIAGIGDSNIEWVEHRAFDAVEPVEDLECAPDGDALTLAWRLAGAYDALAISRNGERVAELAGNAREWTDIDPLPEAVYRVVARRDGARSGGALCEFPRPVAFLRGDVETNGTINLTDAIAILEHLFSGTVEIECLDAADANDDGSVNIADALRLLLFLFLDSAPPEPPFPLPGFDPTPDALVGC